MISSRDYIKSIEDIGRCIQVIIRSRYRQKSKFIITKGIYKSLYISFYKSPYVCQFYIEDRHDKYIVYLLKNDKIVRKDTVLKNELIEHFYKKLLYFFGVIN